MGAQPNRAEVRVTLREAGRECGTALRHMATPGHASLDRGARQPPRTLAELMHTTSAIPPRQKPPDPDPTQSSHTAPNLDL